MCSEVRRRRRPKVGLQADREVRTLGEKRAWSNWDILFYLRVKKLLFVYLPFPNNPAPPPPRAKQKGEKKPRSSSHRRQLSLPLPSYPPPPSALTFIIWRGG